MCGLIVRSGRTKAGAAPGEGTGAEEEEGDEEGGAAAPAGCVACAMHTLTKSFLSESEAPVGKSACRPRAPCTSPPSSPDGGREEEEGGMMAAAAGDVEANGAATCVVEKNTHEAICSAAKEGRQNPSEYVWGCGYGATTGGR